LTKFVQARAVAERSGMLWCAKVGIVALGIGAALGTFTAFPTRGPLSLLVGLALAFVAIVYIAARDLIGNPAEVETQAPQLKRTSILPAPRAHEARQAEVPATMQPGAQSAAGFLERLRQNLAVAESEAGAAAQEVRTRGFVRFRRAEKDVSEDLELAASPGTAGLSVLNANDLRNYFNQRLAASAAGKAERLSPEPERPKIGMRLKSLDAVLDQVVAAGRGVAPSAVLVGGTSAGDSAAAAAITMARAFSATGNMVVLLDLAHGPSSVSSALHLPRSPGLSDLCAGLAQFEDIIRIDAETPLHTIAAGHPRFAAPGDATGRFTPILQALTQTYDSVVLHADRAALRRIGRALRFELSFVVAVLPATAGAGAPAADLGDFSAFGCPVLICEQGGEERRARFLSWSAAL
jgi:Mrp family chromosome partitioning ATPase